MTEDQDARSIRQKAKGCVQVVILEAIDLLSDGDDDSDDIAYSILARLFTVLGEVENMRISWSMRYAAATNEVWFCHGTCGQDEAGPRQQMWTCAD